MLSLSKQLGPIRPRVGARQTARQAQDEALMLSLSKHEGRP